MAELAAAAPEVLLQVTVMVVVVVGSGSSSSNKWIFCRFLQWVLKLFDQPNGDLDWFEVIVL